MEAKDLLSIVLFVCSSVSVGLGILLIHAFKKSKLSEPKITMADYDITYDWVFGSIVSASLSMLLVLLSFITATPILLIVAAICLAAQVTELAIAVVYALWSRMRKVKT